MSLTSKRHWHTTVITIQRSIVVLHNSNCEKFNNRARGYRLSHSCTRLTVKVEHEVCLKVASQLTRCAYGVFKTAWSIWYEPDEIATLHEDLIKNATLDCFAKWANHTFLTMLKLLLLSYLGLLNDNLSSCRYIFHQAPLDLVKKNLMKYYAGLCDLTKLVAFNEKRAGKWWLLPRNGGDPVIIESEPSLIWHYGNAFENPTTGNNTQF